MSKKKAKSKTASKKAAKKKSLGKGKKEMNPAEVRKDIAQMVDAEAAAMAQAVIGEGKKGQLAMVKYLFEMAKIYPEATDGSQSTTDEESLAATLMRRLDLPDEPIGRDEEDLPKAAPSAEKAATKTAGKEDGKDCGSELTTGEKSEESVLV